MLTAIHDRLLARIEQQELTGAESELRRLRLEALDELLAEISAPTDDDERSREVAEQH